RSIFIVCVSGICANTSGWGATAFVFENGAGSCVVSRSHVDRKYFVHWVSGRGQSWPVRHSLAPITQYFTGGSSRMPVSLPFSQWSYHRMISAGQTAKG